MNVAFAQTPGIIQFGEKVEILMNNISLSTLANGVQSISINVLNQVSKWTYYKLYMSAERALIGH